MTALLDRASEVCSSVDASIPKESLDTDLIPYLTLKISILLDQVFKQNGRPTQKTRKAR